MAAWLIPALKAVLPHVGTIVSAAAPVFTRRTPEASLQPKQLQEQITELQSAVSQNGAHIKELAAQLQTTVSALEQAVSIAEARVRRLTLACLAALLLSVVSLCAAFLALVAR